VGRSAKVIAFRPFYFPTYFCFQPPSPFAVWWFFYADFLARPTTKSKQGKRGRHQHGGRIGQGDDF